MPAMLLKSSPVRCRLVPLPLEAKVIFAGSRFAALIPSLIDLSGEAGPTTRTLLNDTSGVMKEKSFMASNGSFA